MSVGGSDYYQILGVARTADERAIKAAFRGLARRYHPDVNPDNAAAERLFRHVHEAYRTLGNPILRRHYDAMCEARCAQPHVAARGAATPITRQPEGAAQSGVWRRFLDEERAACLYSGRWLRHQCKRLRHRLLILATTQ